MSQRELVTGGASGLGKALFTLLADSEDAPVPADRRATDGGDLPKVTSVADWDRVLAPGVSSRMSGTSPRATTPTVAAHNSAQ